MAAPSSLKRFHLVLAHDLRGSDTSRQFVSKFWSIRFPHALITDFTFFDEDSNVSFLNRAQTLLLTIQEARDGADVVSPDGHLPCIFICHGLGGSLVKQALVLASLDRKFGRYATDTALLVLCNTPEEAKDLSTWQLQVCRLLSVSDLGSYSAASLFNELPEALERLYWSFGAIQRHHLIVNVRSKLPESKPNVVQDMKPTVITRGRSTIYTLADEASIWSFTPGNTTAESIFDIVSWVVKQEMQPLSEQFHDFMQLLRRVDSNNYQLEFSRPFISSTELIAKHDSIRDWQSLDPKAPNLLYFRTPQGMSSAAVASHLLDTLSTVIPDYAVVSFSFNKQDLRTQPITTFYVSLIRQLLLSQLSLFRRVSAIGDWIKGEENFSYEIFRSLFLSLLKGASPNPVICVLNDVQDCVGFPLDHIVDLIKEFRRLSNGILKVIVLSEEQVKGAFVNSPDVCRDIDLSTASWSTDSIAGYVQSQMGTLVKKGPHWRGCENEVTGKLRRPSVTYIQATIFMKLLDLENIPSTRSAALDAIEKLPLSGDEIYAAAVGHCESQCPLPLNLLLQWILHSVRPLFMNELAVVAGLAHSGSSSMECLRPNIPLDILNDLRQVKGTLIETVGLQAVPIHKTIVPVLDEKWRLAEEDADSVMLRMCLEYLEIAFVKIPTIESPPSTRGTSRSSRSTTPEPPPGSSEQNRLESPAESTGQQAADDSPNKEEDGSANHPTNGTPISPTPLIEEEEKEGEGEYRRLNVNLGLMLGLEYSLLEYAVTSWPAHYKRARNRETIKGQIISLFSKNHEVRAWSDLYQRFTGMDTEKFETLDSLLNIGCRFGLLDIVKDVIGEVKASKRSKKALSEALDLAVGFGHEEIVSVLIKEGAESNEAPSLAAEFGFLDILRQLVNANPTMTQVKDQFGRPPFLLATLSGNENIASYLMANGADHAAAGGNSITGLQVAAMTGQFSLLRKLVDAGSDIHATVQSRKSSALMLAAAGGFDDIAALLLSRGARINDQDLDGETALHRAVKHGHASTCSLLFAAGADIHIKTTHGLSPIHIASSNGYLGILQELLTRSKELLNQEEKPANVKLEIQTEEDQVDGESQGGEDRANQPNVYDDSLGVRTPLELAASNGYLDIMQELLKFPRYNSEKSRATALLIAASSGFLQLVEELLKTGITTVMKDTNGNNALHLATQEQYPDIVASLLHSDSGLASIFDVNTQNDSGWTPLHLAARSGRLITVQILLRSGASIDNVNSNGETALHISSRHGHVWVVNALMDYITNYPTAEGNIMLMQDSSDDTAFVIAVRQGHYEVASALIKKCTPLKPMELQGQKNALIESASEDHPDLVKLLLDHEWDTSAKDRSGQTPLHLAAGYNLISIMELLIDRGADCNAHSNNGETPLHRATSGGKVAIRTLLDKGADINAKDIDGTTPLYRASYMGRDDVVEALLEWSPKPELDAQNSANGWTALHACYDSARITELLLRAGADPMVLTQNGDPTFFLAADYYRGHETLQKYIDAGTDINTKIKDGTALIHLAADDGTIDTVKLLHRNGADILSAKENGETALHLAAKTDDRYAILKYLLEQDVDLEADCESFGTPLMAATRSRREATELLLQKGAKVNAISKLCTTHNALQTAVSKGSCDVVNDLIEAGADAGIRGGSSGSALCAAVARDNKDIVMLVLDKDKDINYAEGPKGSALELALARQSFEIAELFFERGVDVNVVSKGKYGTALIAAVDVGEVSAVEKLVELKADVNLFPAGGESPVQTAIRRGRQNIVEVLVKNGAKLDYRDKGGRGVLSHAISHQSFELLRYLLYQPGVDIDQQDAIGRTPLIHATIQGHTIVDDILARRPRVNLKDRWGKTALAYAVSRNYGLLVSKLIAENADPLIQDIRGRDALYWAALQGSWNTFGQVLKEMKAIKAPTSRFRHAVHAATAADNSDFVRQLLKESHPWDEHTDQDGWTAAYTALRYDRGDITSLVTEEFKGAGRLKWEPSTQPKPPTQWHPTDMSGYLAREPDIMSIKVRSEAYFPGADEKAIARADHPMVPNEDGIYYFEITVTNGGNGKRLFGVGFCEEGAHFNNMLGWQEGAWGYHGDDGHSFESGQFSVPYGPFYDEGSVVGCGVNFNEGTAFYTYNGDVIGRAFANVRGKLYPAVSIDTRMAGCILTARFWDKNEMTKKLFKFQGPYDSPATLDQSQRYKNEGGVDRGKDTDAMSTTYSSGEYDSD